MLNTRGFTLFETIVSLALLPLIILIVIQSVFNEIDALMHARANRDATRATSAILERLTQEIRLGQSVVTASSVLEASPGRLVLQSFTAPTSTIPATVDIELSGTDVTIERNGNTTTLSGTRARVTELTFHHATSPNSEVVRMHITVETGTARFEKEKQFTTAVVLRGSY